LITAGANRWPNAGDEVRRTAAVDLYHRFDRPLGSFVEGAFPSGVSQADGPPNGIVEGDGHTVSETEHEKYARTIGDQSIGLEGDTAPVLGSDRSHVGTVHLMGRDDVTPADAQGPTDEVIVRVHSLLVVAHRFAHVQPVVRRATDSTQPGEDAVDDLSIACQTVETIVEKPVVVLSPQGSVPLQVDHKCNTKG
jgi:hypothetical protein